ncbi:MAG: hypothetical protein ACM359_02280 [Bacillota bacterium]
MRPASAELPRYTVTPLFTLRLPGDNEQLVPWAINNYGQIVGHTAEVQRAFLWTPTVSNGTQGTLVDLGDLDGGQVRRVVVTGLNNRGQIVGQTIAIDGTRSAYLWNPTSPNASTGSMVSILPRQGSESDDIPWGINDRGQFAITRSAPSSVQIWDPDTPNGSTGSLHEIANLPGEPYRLTWGAAMNNRGQITGQRAYKACLWSPVTPNATSGTFVELGDYGDYTQSAGVGINDSGQIIGQFVGEKVQTFLWTPTSPNDSTGSYRSFGYDRARAINNSGHVVGSTNTARGFIWPGSGKVVDLNTRLATGTTGWTIEWATDINDLGQILAFGTYDPPGPEIYHNAPVLLTPIGIPEPSAIMLLPLMLLVRLLLSRNHRPPLPKA